MNSKSRSGTRKIFAFFLCLLFCRIGYAVETINLSGNWRFSLDRADTGISDNWSNQHLKETITLPGVLQSQNYGDEIGTATPWVLSLYDRAWFLREDYKNYTKTGGVKVPFLSQPPRHYLGAAWYQREIEIPQNWRGKRVVLFLERPHWESTVWLDNKKISSNRSLVAPHVYDFGILVPGKHSLSIRVDNRILMPYRPDAHSISDSLGMSWNGIVGKIELRATSQVWIEDAQIFPDPEKKSALLKIKIGNASGKSGGGFLTANGKEFPVTWKAEGGSAEIEVQFPKEAQNWDEFHPVLQKISLSLKGENADDSRELSFGLRRFSARGNEFILNGRPVYFRGTHHGGDFPLTGYPPTDVEYWRRILQINKDWGINHIRFHSFCPPEAAFQAADELGIYLQPEPGMWNEVSPGTPMEKMLYEETEALIKAYGNHPSFLLLSPSNEPKGRWKESFDKWIAYYRKADSRRLYTNGTGHTEREVPALAEGTDYLAVQRIGPKMLRGNSAWFGRDYGNSLENVKIPVVSHELGQWVAYPDYEVIKKFTGYMRPGNYEIFRDSLAAKGLLAKNKDFAYASGRYQLACYKEEIEANLRTPGLQGFQLLDLHDYLGQGTALVGLLDPFWEEKGYVTAREFRRFNSETVPLARLQKRVFTTQDAFSIDAEIAHYGEKPIGNAKPYWKIADSRGRVVLSGELPGKTIEIGKNIALGKITADLAKLDAPGEYKLIVGLKNTNVENDWNFWLYPAKISKPEPKGVFITHSWGEAETKLRGGGKVLYMPRKADLDWASPPLDTVPVFWNRLMNPAWSRMLGLWIDTKSPALAKFPTANYSDWQWMEIVRNARAVNLDKLPESLQPIVQPIDDWNRNYKLGMIFEAKVERGKLLVSSADLENDLDRRPVARQLRQSILDYMASAKFLPKTTISSENFREIFFDTRIMKKLGASAKAAAAGDAANAIDGDPNTFWLAGDAKQAARQNQELIISFPNAVPMTGLVVMPRQNHREHEGDIRQFSVQISDDGNLWREVTRGALVSAYEPQRILFNQTVSGKFLKLVSLSGFGNDKTTAIADLAVIYAGAKLPDTDEDLEYKRNQSASPDIDEGTNNNTQKPNKKPRKP